MKRIISVLLTLAISLSLFSVLAFATNNQENKSAMNMDISDGMLSDDTMESLKQNNIEISTAPQYVTEYDSSIHARATKVRIDSENYMCLNESGEIYRIRNFNAPVSLSSESPTYDEIVNNVVTMLELSDEYVLQNTDEFDNDLVRFTISRVYENGMTNPYESVKFSARKEDGTVVYLRRFSNAPISTTISISEPEALATATEVAETFGGVVTSVTLSCKYPNDGFAEGEAPIPCYIVSIDDGAYMIQINALTGEIMRKEAAQADKAGCYGQTDDNYISAVATTITAQKGFKKLGYTAYRSNDSTTELTETVRNFMEQPDSYGFYFRGHGSAMRISTSIDNENYIGVLNKKDVEGNWHFVFIDTCHSADDTSWADAFNITDSHANRAFLGWNGKVYPSKTAAFADAFWPLVGTMSIQNAAVQAADEVPGKGTTPIRFYGDDYYYGTAWN